MKTLDQFLTEAEQFNEHVLSIGINPAHEHYREKHRQDIHDILKHSYRNLGGYGGLGHGTPEESKSIHKDISDSLIKVTTREGKPTSARLYKPQHGRKSIALGATASTQGKTDARHSTKEDFKQKRAWGEVSGTAEHLATEYGAPRIPASSAKSLIGKDVKSHDDGYHYDRDIGGHSHTKMIVGYPKT